MPLTASLAQIIDSSRILDKAINIIAYANDAGFYRLTPQVIVQPNSISEIQKLFEYSQNHNIPLTFRAAGTSLSGQAITDGILVDISRYWRKFSIEAMGKKIRSQPGVITGLINQHLKPYNLKFGPDPASINSCMIGGVLANNASGMDSGVSQNSYHTLQSMTMVLTNGFKIDSTDPDANDQLKNHSPDIYNGLIELKKRLDNNKELQDKVKNKYKMKNVVGYSLNAFLDFDTPVDILSHLMIGSEGTLGFIAEAVLSTVPNLPIKYTGLLFFADIQKACSTIAVLKKSGANTVELMDRAALRSVENQEGAPAFMKELPERAVAFLVEYGCYTEAELDDIVNKTEQLTESIALLEKANFTKDPLIQAKLWKIRKGMLPSVGAVRPRGTTVLIEDVTLPLDKLADAVTDIQQLFSKHHYDSALIFGHVKSGNIHFVLSQSFNSEQDIKIYEAFMADLVGIIVHKYDGALKGEHGTGRNMAPFVETEWGEDAYDIMLTLKQLLDPKNLLNPGVIINHDKDAHIKNIKQLALVEPEINQCIECGFCEPVCPSRDLTLTPRQRIIVRREMARLKSAGDSTNLLAELKKDYQYYALDTCAVDGLCSTVCPVGINTGTLTKQLRDLNHSQTAENLAKYVARQFSFIEKLLRLGLKLAHFCQSLIGAKTITAITKAVKNISTGHIWSAKIPDSASAKLPFTKKETAHAVYFPNCVSRIMGNIPEDQEKQWLVHTFVNIAQRAGQALWIPDDCSGYCCGMPFQSKGFREAYLKSVNDIISQFWIWSDQGKLPIVMDTTPCVYTLRSCRQDLSPENQLKYDQLTILDSIEFVHDYLLENLSVKRKLQSVVLHPTCSASKLNITPKLRKIASVCSVEVDIPKNAGCCAMAGDRGFLHPELTASATQKEATEVNDKKYDGYYSSSKTCEIGMTQATNHVYHSILYLIDRVTKP